MAAEEIYTPLNKFHSSQYLKKHYGIDRDFLLYVGGFSPRKNILGLIEAFNLVKNSYKRDLKLVIIGTKGPSYEIYRKKVDELNLSSSVIFTGFIPINDMPIFYSASKALVYPSFYEGFGLPPIECMACGTPVIASNLTSMPEVCQDAALLVDPYDVDEIKENILTLLNNHKFYSLMIYKGLVIQVNLIGKKLLIIHLRSTNIFLHKFKIYSLKFSSNMSYKKIYYFKMKRYCIKI